MSGVDLVIVIDVDGRGTRPHGPELVERCLPGCDRVFQRAIMAEVTSTW